MVEHDTPATCGVDHVGLSVRDPESTRRFFCDCLGWQVEAPDRASPFDRRTNVGLQHLAVADRAGLDALYERVAKWPGVVVESSMQSLASE
jgi:catechol 2,3-dioxygenase-like lactoylglutathione lyase family enzyme